MAKTTNKPVADSATDPLAAALAAEAQAERLHLAAVEEEARPRKLIEQRRGELIQARAQAALREEERLAQLRADRPDLAALLDNLASRHKASFDAYQAGQAEDLTPWRAVGVELGRLKARLPHDPPSGEEVSALRRRCNLDPAPRMDSSATPTYQPPAPDGIETHFVSTGRRDL